ncbi:hypothetical protein [Actinoplanes sp. NPDC051851]|uniref:hypothetical protein n=1 Tax=Actinoplanes sp. NPDC051851 TaxID=3154753 RepID=UPI0034187D58
MQPEDPIVAGELPEPYAVAPEPPRRPWWKVLEPGSHRPWQRQLVVALGSAAVLALLGVPLGLLWAWLAPDVPVIATDSGIVVNDPSPEQYIAADGWFTLLGLGFGLLAAILAWLLLRRDRGPALLIGVIGGTFVAGRWVAGAVGEMIGRDAYADWRAAVTHGATYLAPPQLHATGPKLVPAFAAAIVLTLLAGWSNDPDLDLPGAHPGYGPNHEIAAGGPIEGDVVESDGTVGDVTMGDKTVGDEVVGDEVVAEAVGGGRPEGEAPVSSGLPGEPDPTAAPAPPAPGPADRPRG